MSKALLEIFTGLILAPIPAAMPRPPFKRQDKRNASGFPYWGQRIVKKHGLVSWHHVTYYHPDLEAYEGDMVEVSFNGSCVWSDGVTIADPRRRWVDICEIKDSLEGRELAIREAKKDAAWAALQKPL